MEDEENDSASTKKIKTAQMIRPLPIPPPPLGLYGMVKIIAVHMMLSSQCYLKSGLLTQSFGQEDSRKSINTISNHYLPVSKNILMDRPVLKLPEILSGMGCIHKILQNFPMEPEAQVLQL